jgi:signal transduction histidine kinase
VTVSALFAQRYAEALSTSVDDEAMDRAYELGRAAMEEGLGVLDVTTIHANAVSANSSLEPRCAWQFLSAALGPFEMAFRGFRDANVALQHAAENLERRVQERTSELRAAEQRVREKTRLLHSVVESMSDGLVVADRSGKLLLLNGAGERLLGPEALRRPPTEWAEACGVFRPDGVTRFEPGQGPILRALRGELPSAAAIFVKNAGTPEGVHVVVLSSPLRDDTGHVSGGIALLRDVTESKRAEDALSRTEEQVRQLQKMDAVGRLAGGVAHDFNNILSVIISLSDAAQESLAPGEPLLEDLQEIHKAGTRAASLTRQLLLFSRQQLFEPTRVDLQELLSSMDKMLRRLIGADIELVTVTGSAGARVLADPASLEQVVMNLVVNARDAMPRGGRLTIETADVEVDEDFASHHVGLSVGPHVMLAVSDTGMGMDKATQARVFEPFFTTKEKGKGTGLGLSMVFGIVRKSHGAVWLYSEPGVGTTFKIYLPRVEAPSAPQPQSLAPGTLRGDETILLVEDDEQVRSVAAGILRRHGYQVLEARNAGEAVLLEEAHAGTIHLLLTDVVMPQVSGPELARRIARNRPDMKIICMSGYTDDSVVRHGVLDSKVNYLQKPITPDTLLAKVRAVLGR